jgi:multidrug resistance efflux pump
LTQNYVEGTAIKAGQVLFTLDRSESVGHLGMAGAQLNETDRQVQRLRPLARERNNVGREYKDALVAQRAARAAVNDNQAPLNAAKANHNAAIEAARAAVEMANASIHRAKLNLEYCTIVTPVDGSGWSRAGVCREPGRQGRIHRINNGFED